MRGLGVSRPLRLVIPALLNRRDMETFLLELEIFLKTENLLISNWI